MNADIFIFLWIPFTVIHTVHCYDGYSTCSKPFRSSKSWSDLPCDFKDETWCVLPGIAYPWHAVRRFVFENHGLMKRMYGEQRHFSVLRAEIDSNDLDLIHNGWHDGIQEPSFKKYDKHTPTILRQTFNSDRTFNAAGALSSSSSTSTAGTSKIANTFSTSASSISSSITTTTSKTTTSDDKLTMADVPFSTENDDLTTTDSLFDTTIAEELPLSTPTTTQSTVSSLSTSRIMLPQFFQETTSRTTNFKVKGINACPVKEEVVAPFWANNTRGEVLALLNLYPFEQYVHWERCSYEHKQMYCRQGCRCEQQYRLHRLLAYDPTNDCRGIFSDWFKFPSCCVCKCYDITMDIRQTSRSPRSQQETKNFPPYFPLGWND